MVTKRPNPGADRGTLGDPEEGGRMSRRPRFRLRELPLRTKLAVTVLGTGLLVLGVATQWSFRYWRAEAVAVVEQQALMAALSVRTTVESALMHGQKAQARAGLRRLGATAPVTGARVYAADGTIVLSTEETEEGRRPAGVWLPSGRDVPEGGLVRQAEDGQAVRAFLPVAAPGATLLEVRFTVAPLQAAMTRGARLALAMLIGSLLAMGLIFALMFEREVMGRVQRVSWLLERPERSGRDELRSLEVSVAELVQKERDAAREAAEQRRRIAEQAGFAQVGELAAEMAHEFKRPLASIRTAMELLKQEYALESGGSVLIGRLDAQLDRLSETMRDVFALAKPADYAPEPLDLQAVIDGALMQLAGHPAAHRVSVVRSYDDMPPVYGDAKRLEQALANLLLNGAEAMPQGGTLTVRAGPAGEGWVEVEVTDTGVGIPPEEIERVLKPFYSTKPAGTGLGLPLVGRVVASHGGRLTLDSEAGAGTTARVHLPVRGAASLAAAQHDRRTAEEAEWQTHAS
jgi:signal transduction histidine kinase